MADRPFDTPLPADLPEDWTSGQIVAPAGADVGLSEQHGYNYLMEQVNAVQRAANAISESFDTISGKRTCRVTVGASAAGWTQADCDYLCDGTDDQVELNAAIAAVQAAGGGEIALLAGGYNISEEMKIDASIVPLTLSGEPGAAVLNMAGIIRVEDSDANASPSPAQFLGLTFHTGSGAAYVSAVNCRVAFEDCRFLGVGLYFGQNQNDAQAELLFRRNYMETQGAGTLDDWLIGVVANSGTKVLISGNVLKGKGSTKQINILGYSGEASETSLVVVSDNVLISAQNDDRGVFMSGTGCLSNNFVRGTGITVEGSASCVGNVVAGGRICAGTSCAVAGNNVSEGSIVAGEYAAVTGNCIAASAGTAAISLHRLGPNNTPAKETAVVVGNVVTAGSIGVHLTDEGMIGTSISQTNALVASNRITGCATSIQIESNWSGCLVTGNMIDSPVVDRGAGNLVRLNSDDDGGGGSGTAGVTSFKGRSGVVVPLAGDYTASMVGARPDTWTPSAADVGAIPSGSVQSIQALTQEEYDALATKSDTTLYLIEE